MILCLCQNNLVTTVYDIFHLYISYHSSSSSYVALITPVLCQSCSLIPIGIGNKLFHFGDELTSSPRRRDDQGDELTSHHVSSVMRSS